MLPKSSSTSSTENFSYPLFLDPKGKKTVVVGGGKVAERKVLALLKAGADVRVISPFLTARLRGEKRSGSITHVDRRYKKGDLKGAFIVIAATDSQDVNEGVANEAPFLLNVVDVPRLCNFIAPSVVKRGRLTIAISTGGASPALSKAIRKELEKVYSSDIAGYLEFTRKIRTKALSGIVEKKKREKFLKSLAAEKILVMLRTKGLNAVKKKVLEDYEKIAG